MSRYVRAVYDHEGEAGLSKDYWNPESKFGLPGIFQRYLTNNNSKKL